jgi:hypothetical protein
LPAKLPVYGATGSSAGVSPASAYGPDFVVEAEGVMREDVG